MSTDSSEGERQRAPLGSLLASEPKVAPGSYGEHLTAGLVDEGGGNARVS